MSGNYAFGKTVEDGPDDAIRKVTEALAAEGFGVLTTIDIAATLKKKLGEDTAPYVILGACNPQFAHRALQAEPEIGTLLPCNVVVRQQGDGATRVDIMDPQAVLRLTDRPEVAAIAGEVRMRLQRVLAAI